MLVKDPHGPLSQSIQHTSLLTLSSPDLRSQSNSTRSLDLLSSSSNHLARSSSPDLFQSHGSALSSVSSIGSSDLLHSDSPVLSRVLKRDIPIRATYWHQIIREAMISTERESGGHVIAVTHILDWVMENMGKCIDGCWKPLPLSSRRNISSTIRSTLRTHSPAYFIVEQADVKSYSLNPLAFLAPKGKIQAIDYFFAPRIMTADVHEESDGPLTDPYENCVSDESEPQYDIMQPRANIDPSLEEVAWCFSGL
jgi:hypothetical protein